MLNLCLSFIYCICENVNYMNFKCALEMFIKRVCSDQDFQSVLRFRQISDFTDIELNFED